MERLARRKLRPHSTRATAVAALCILAVGVWADSRNPYLRDPAKAETALRAWSTGTLARPAPAAKLFVEGYFMRGLVAAQSVPMQSQSDGEGVGGASGVARATAFADSLVAQQQHHGFWSIGYATSWLADMGAALGVFHALEAHVDSGRAQRYEKAAETFIAAIVRDGMMLESGALGVGWPITGSGATKAWRSDVGWADDPYLVSTALVGIELQAWLFRRTRAPEYRRRALAALEYTLSQLQRDGSLPSLVRGEGANTVAAYTQEGWMAADLLLDDAQVTARLRQALLPHVEWLLRTQRSDGTWDSDMRGDFARTPAIADFLIWYDQRCESRDDVKAAVRKAGAFLMDPKRWEKRGFLDASDTAEIWRALVGRPLAALASGKPVL